MKLLKKSAFFYLLFFSAFAQAVENFSTQKIYLKNIPIIVEVAKTEKERAQGLMYRTQLKKDSGMLFIFEEQRILSFWMKNTKIPLSIAYFNQEGILIDVQDMKPEKGEALKTYPSKSPAKYALEMNIGWFQKKNIGLGSRLVLKTK